MQGLSVPSNYQPLLTRKDVAAILGVTVRTVSTLISTKQLPVIRLRRAVRIQPLTLKRFIRTREKQSIAPNKEVAR
jgi:excisionase family DNA binding protein